MLLDLLDEHRGAFEFDWRSRFHLGVESIPTVIDWAEACRLVEVLMTDPSSQLAAAFMGWTHASTREELTLRDLYDMQHQSKSKRKPKKLPRPWDRPPKRHGAGTSLSIAAYEALKDKLSPGTS